MSLKVGIPIMKCSLHPSQTVNAKTGKKSKTCAVDKAWNEMNDERIGRDETIDKSMTHKNVWMVGDTNDDVPALVQKEIDRVNEERKAAGLKAVRKDCVTAIAIIDKPSMSYMQELSYEDKVKFLNASNKVMTEMLHEWNPNWRIIEAVQHHDEFGGLSAHNHRIVLIPSENEDGIAFFNAKREVNLKFFNFINKEYSQRMQALGYEVENCRTYDMLTEEEKQERKLNPPEHGLSSQDYKQKNMKNLAIDYEKILNENKSLKEEIHQKDTLILKLKAEVEKYKQMAFELKEKVEQVIRKAGNRLAKAFGLEPSPEVSEYPAKEISSEIKDMTQTIGEKDTRQFRVIPDEESGKYRVAYRTDSGKYETVKGGFSSRDLAEKYRKNISEAARDLGEKIADGIKNGIS